MVLLKSIASKLFEVVGYSINKNNRLPSQLITKLVLEKSLERTEEHIPIVVQVGAHNGRKSDPIHELLKTKRVRGILIEPLPDEFVNLKKTYEGYNNLVLENIAVAHKDGEVTIHRISPDFEPIYRKIYPIDDAPSGKSSLDRMRVKHYLETTIPDYFKDHDVDSCISGNTVPCLSFKTLISKHELDYIDLLQIDTEGFDFEIIKMVFQTTHIRPRVINFEHKFLSPQETSECHSLLLENNYTILTQNNDTCAFRSICLN